MPAARMWNRKAPLSTNIASVIAQSSDLAAGVKGARPDARERRRAMAMISEAGQEVGEIDEFARASERRQWLTGIEAEQCEGVRHIAGFQGGSGEVGSG